MKDILVFLHGHKKAFGYKVEVLPFFIISYQNTEKYKVGSIRVGSSKTINAFGHFGWSKCN